jgi:hypothetical protein
MTGSGQETSCEYRSCSAGDRLLNTALVVPDALVEYRRMVSCSRPPPHEALRERRGARWVHLTIADGDVSVCMAPTAPVRRPDLAHLMDEPVE